MRIFEKVVLWDFTNRDICTTKFNSDYMPFKFVNWFLAQKIHNNTLGKLAQKCVDDPAFPKKSKYYDEILDYLETKKATKKEIQALNDGWNEFRKLSKVKVDSLRIIESRRYGIW
jgi:uncharacterized protein YozE (UPF0346 family)